LENFSSCARQALAFNLSNMSVSSKKILILGGRGRLAASLAQRWSINHEVVSWGRAEADVSNIEKLRSQLESVEFDILVNGSGATNVDGCESAREEAQTVNALAPQTMAECATRRGARFIHFSTDYVFDGKKDAALMENDPANPGGWYGQTKLNGENLVLADSPKHLVVRVSWVFGPAKPSFVDMIIQRALENDHVEAVADKFSAPTYAPDVADWLEPFLSQDLPGGLYHACNSGSCSWREYGEKALEFAAEAGMPLKTTKVGGIPLAQMKQFIAPRPVFSILSTSKLAAATGITPRHWHDALREYIFEKHASLPSRS
jgi:dTDP-4-dehydrorhamnose reductase